MQIKFLGSNGLTKLMLLSFAYGFFIVFDVFEHVGRYLAPDYVVMFITADILISAIAFYKVLIAYSEYSINNFLTNCSKQTIYCVEDAVTEDEYGDKMPYYYKVIESDNPNN